jgi:hypothetical protein
VLDETSQGGIPLESTLADDFSLLCPLQMDSEQVLHRPVEITAFIGTSPGEAYNKRSVPEPARKPHSP